MKKINFRWIVILICLSVLLPLQSCKKTPRLDSSLKSFSNQYFTFQYPKDWKIEDNPNQLSITGPEELGYYVNLKIDYNPSVDLPLNDFLTTVETQNNLSKLWQFKDMGTVEMTINGQPALQHSILTAIQIKEVPLYLFVRLTYFVKGKLGIVITAEIPQDVLAKYEQSINGIIQSFRMK
ncbi:hypothetical protein LLG10_05610 [bacterium]|nr:hypothetical protein [bacterium]